MTRIEGSWSCSHADIWHSVTRVQTNTTPFSTQDEAPTPVIKMTAVQLHNTLYCVTFMDGSSECFYKFLIRLNIPVGQCI